MSAITAVTIQNTRGVKSVIPINPKEIAEQILFTCKDIKPIIHQLKRWIRATYQEINTN